MTTAKQPQTCELLKAAGQGYADIPVSRLQGRATCNFGQLALKQLVVVLRRLRAVGQKDGGEGNRPNIGPRAAAKAKWTLPSVILNSVRRRSTSNEPSLSEGRMRINTCGW